MPSVQISIRKELYEKLKKMKNPNQSFSDFIEEKIIGASNFQEVISCYGIAGKNNDPEVMDAYREAQKILNKSLIPNNDQEI